MVQSADTTFWDAPTGRTLRRRCPGTDGSLLGHSIADTAQRRMVPGDKVAAVFGAEVNA